MVREIAYLCRKKQFRNYHRCQNLYEIKLVSWSKVVTVPHPISEVVFHFWRLSRATSIVGSAAKIMG